MLERHIFLIGTAGSGKSSLGRRVAAKLQLPFIDTDQRIAELTGMNLPELYEREGGEAYRTAETNLLMMLIDATPSIISTGGECAAIPVNREIMRNHGYIILIDRPPEDITQDIRLETRPQLLEKGAHEIYAFYAEHKEDYRTLADVVLDNVYGYQNAVQTLEKMITSRFNLN
ncbi:MAG: shikimate kinase [Clostridia bacterium]|nr:shikimate kinase [Clostridia bacterium]